jgi:DNA-directed RNA polymerase I subunit RPA43
MPSTVSSYTKSKPEKKHRSKEEKKRKRDKDESGRHKSKKHRKHQENGELRHEIATASPFHTQTATLYLPLAPISQRNPLEGLCAEHLSPLILTYYPPLSGVILSYSNARMSEDPFGDDGSETLLQCIDEFAVSWAWLTATFLLFKPGRGELLEGYINLQNEGHLGLVCWNLFNASIERQRLPTEWKWVGVEEAATTTNKGLSDDGENYAEGGIGYYVDGNGAKIEGTIKFRVKDIESSHDRERGFLSIEGTMLEEEAEKDMLEKEIAARKFTKEGPGRRLGGSRGLGATSLGVPSEPGADGFDNDRGRRKY